MHLFLKGCVHLDIKCENLVQAGAQWTLIDFGLAEPRGKLVESAYVVTDGYRPPEQTMCAVLPACTSLDVYALGVTALEMVLRTRLYGQFKACAGSNILRMLLVNRLLRRVTDTGMQGAIRDMLREKVNHRRLSITRLPDQAST